MRGFLPNWLTVPLLTILLLGSALPGLPAQAEEIDFARDLRPVFERYCSECHGSEKQRGGLRLDNPAGLTAGGDSGPLFATGKPAESLLIKVLTGADGTSAMPPEGKPRPNDAERQLIHDWIAQGARLPAGSGPAGEAKTSSHWSFQPVRRTAPPAVKDSSRVRNPVDAFVVSRLETEGLSPSAEADRVTVIRRLSLDLLGLPPTPAEVNEFVQDTRPNAYELLVDRLLQSPHFGERWGRHWLDTARYADSNGFTRDTARSIWMYREWVIEAFNRDLPFDQFTVEQIAGDMLPNSTRAQKVATGFHRNTLVNEEGGTDPEQFRVESIVDRVNTTGLVFLGLTLGCAQCHEHKYDPITQREYYQFYAFLNNADEPRLEAPSAEQLARGDLEKRETLRKQIADLEQKFSARKEEFQGAIDAWEKAFPDAERPKLPMEVLNALNLSPVMRSEQNKTDLSNYYRKLPEAQQKFPELAEIVTLSAQIPQFVTTLVMQERPQPRKTHIHIRGDFLRHGTEVQPSIPAALPPLALQTDRPNRLDLARWLIDSRNPLTPRVTINRVWQKLFGRGIVETENDFGTQGTPPTHPELLDWLAAEFMQPTQSTATPAADGSLAPEIPWSLKRMLKLLVTSATYRQSSHWRPELAEVDPANKLYARQNRLRLEAEAIRDSALVASGLLSRKIGGPSVNPPQPEGVFEFTQDKKPWNTATGADRYRRGMYTYLWRSSLYPAMAVFDFPDANVTCTRRNRSNTPLQSLTLANDQQFVEFAQGLARRVLTDGPTDDSSRLRQLFRLCLAREPGPTELQRLSDLLAQQRQGFAEQPEAAKQLTSPDFVTSVADAEFASWTSVARVLINLDEFITRE
ncbi:MAG TPA: hypothetical protein DDY91_08180 [Planctomycetaceae bacterium]|nr:hypothetical protein [Planctomycetaceae bacterium]